MVTAPRREDSAVEALADVSGVVGRFAIAARARGDGEEERRWLDVAALLERVTLAADREPDGLRAAVEALADEFEDHTATPECMDDNGYRCRDCTTARAIRDLLAAHPASDQPEVRS